MKINEGMKMKSRLVSGNVKNNLKNIFNMKGMKLNVKG